MKKCKQGYYYCHTDKKCKRIPTGYRVGLGGYLRKENGEEQGENDNADNTNGNGNGNGNSNGGSNGGGVSEGTLHKWFAGSKSKGEGGKKGTPGWVNVTTGGTCASDEPGEGVPKCVSRDKYDSMTPEERRSASRRKKEKDKGQQLKRNAAKPTYVATDKPKKKKKMTNESKDLKKIAKELHGASKMHKKQAKRVEKHIKDMHKEEKQPKNCGCGKNPCMTYGKKKKSHDCASKVEHKEYGIGDCIKEMHTLDSTGNVTHYDVMFEHGIEKNVFVGDLNILVSEMHEHVINADKNKELLETKDKKGKGSGTKDACYHKVKSRYSVWPSAYASGALVKCRKVGAANWGNKSEEMDYASFAAKAKETVKKNKEKTLKGETKTKKEEWIVDNAAQYFFNEGINEEGLAIFIEELGVENFVEFVHDLAEDSELIEAYALTGKKKTPKRLPKGTQPAKTTKATIARGDRTIKAASPSGAFKKRPAASKAVETAKEKQPEKKPVKSTLVKGVADTLARGALSAWQGHKAAMKKKKEGKSVASQVGAGLATAAGSMLKKGKKHLSDDYQYSDWRDDFKAMEYEFIDLIKPEPLVVEGHPMYDPEREKKATSLPAINPKQDPRKNKTNLSIGRSADAGEPNADKILKKRTGGASLPSFKTEEVETIDEAGKKCWKGYKKAGTQKLFGKTYNRCVKANEEFVDEERSARRAKNPRKYADVKKEIDNKEFRAGKLTAAQKHEIEKKNVSKYTNFSGKRMTGSGGHGSENRVNPRISYIRNQYEIESDWRSEIEEGAAWTKKSGKNPSGGLNEKGRKSYERENPGSDLKRPSKKKGNKRRASFCARMKGMKKKLTSSKTANDPDSRINKSLRAWNC